MPSRSGIHPTTPGSSRLAALLLVGVISISVTARTPPASASLSAQAHAATRLATTPKGRLTDASLQSTLGHRPPTAAQRWGSSTWRTTGGVGGHHV
jgi:hypothetical protein